MTEELSRQVAVQRATLRRQSNCRFVDANEFGCLAISPRRLYRADVARAGLRGLFEPETGRRYFIAEELLEGHG